MTIARQAEGIGPLRQPQGWIYHGLTDCNGSVPPVRPAGKQSSDQRDRPAATRGQLYPVLLPLVPALRAEPNVGSMADTVSTSAGADRLLTLHTWHPTPKPGMRHRFVSSKSRYSMQPVGRQRRKAWWSSGMPARDRALTLEVRAINQGWNVRSS